MTQLRRRLLAGDERGRKLRRVAPAFRRRDGLFRSRVRVWLDHFAIQMPSRMAEHRHHHHKPEERRQRADPGQPGHDQSPHRHGDGIREHHLDQMLDRGQQTDSADEQQRGRSTLIISTTRANRKPTPLPTTISVQPSGVVKSRWRKSGILAGGRVAESRGVDRLGERHQMRKISTSNAASARMPPIERGAPHGEGIGPSEVETQLPPPAQS